MPDLPPPPWETASAAPPPAPDLPPPPWEAAPAPAAPAPPPQSAAVNPFNRQLGADVSYGAPLGGAGGPKQPEGEPDKIGQRIGAYAELAAPYIRGAVGLPRLGKEAERGALEAGAAGVETLNRPFEWALGRPRFVGQDPMRALSGKLRSMEPEVPPAKGTQEKVADIVGQTIGAAPVGIAAWQGGVPYALLSGTGVAEDVAKTKGKEATTWEKVRDSLVEGGQRALMGWILRTPWGRMSSIAAAGAVAGGASEIEERGHESAAIDAGLNAIFAGIGPKMSPKDQTKISSIMEKAKAGDYTAFDDWLKDPKNASLIAKPLAMAARDRGGAEAKPPRLEGPPPGPPRLEAPKPEGPVEGQSRDVTDVIYGQPPPGAEPGAPSPPGGGYEAAPGAPLGRDIGAGAEPLPPPGEPPGVKLTKMKEVGLGEEEGRNDFEIHGPDGFLGLVYTRMDDAGNLTIVSTASPSGKPGSVGPSLVKQTIKALQDKFPDMKTINGVRVSGAKKNLDEIQRTVKIPLPEPGAPPGRDIGTGGYEAAPKAEVVPVIRARDGELLYGKPGQLHTDLPFDETKWAHAGGEDLGFAVPGGKFMTRGEAFDYVKANVGPNQRPLLDAEAYNLSGKPPPGRDTPGEGAPEGQPPGLPAVRHPPAEPPGQPPRLGGPAEPPLLPPPAAPGEPPRPGLAVPYRDWKTGARRAAAEVATQITWQDRGNAIWRNLIGPFENMWKGILDKARIQSMTDYMRGNPIKPEEQRFFATAREAFDRMFTEEEAAGIEYDWRENYWPGQWTDESRAADMRAQGRGGGPSFAKGKLFDDLQEGIAAGLVPKQTNPAVYVLARLEHGELWKSRVETMKAFEKSGLAKADKDIVKDARDRLPFEYSGYQAVDIAGTRYMVHPAAAEMFRRGLHMDGKTIAEELHLDPYGKTAKYGGKLYDAWMSVRNSAVPLKLSLSAFHPFHISTIGVKSELAGLLTQAINRRITLKEVVDNLRKFSSRGHYEAGKLEAEKFPQRIQDLVANDRIAQWIMLAGGYTPQRPSVYQVKAEEKLRRLFNDIVPSLEQQLDAKNAGTLSRLFQLAPQEARGLALQMGKIIENIQHPLFGDWIPAMKTSAYLNESAAFLKGHPELLAATPESTIKLKDGLREIQKSIDNRFGEMQYDKAVDNPFVGPRLYRKALTASVLSVGWQLGFIREFGGGIAGGAKSLVGVARRDPVQREITTRTAYALTYTAGALAMGGLATYFFTGKPPSEGKDFLYPKLADGSRVNTPLFTREFGAMYYHWQDEGFIPGTASLLENKLVPMISTLHEIYKNEDYFGRQVYDERAPLWTQIEQGMKHFGIGAALPISIQSVLGAGTDDPAKIAMSIGGFSPAPKYVTRTGTESKILRTWKKFEGGGRKTPYAEIQQQSDRQDLKKLYKKQLQSGTPEDRQAYETKKGEFLDKYSTSPEQRKRHATSLKVSESNWAKPGNFNLLKALPPTEQRELLKGMPPAEREAMRWAVRLDLRDEFPMVDDETFRMFTPDEQKTIIEAAPATTRSGPVKHPKAHYMKIAGEPARGALPPPPWQQKQ